MWEWILSVPLSQLFKSFSSCAYVFSAKYEMSSVPFVALGHCYASAVFVFVHTRRRAALLCRSGC